MGCSASVHLSDGNEETLQDYANSLPFYSTPADPVLSYNMRDDREPSTGAARARPRGNRGFTRDTFSYSNVTKIQLRRVVMFVNPVSGKKGAKGMAGQVLEIFKAAGIETTVVETKHARHIVELVRDYDVVGGEGVDAFVVLGGDGTLHEAVNGLKLRADKKAVPIGVVPLGTGNNFFRDVEHMHQPDGVLKKKHSFSFDPLEAARWIAAGNVLPVDAARVDHATYNGAGQATTYSINCIGWGLVALAAKRAEGLRAFGSLRYDIGGLLEIIGNERHRAKFTAIDGAGGERVLQGDWTTVLLQMNVCSGSAMAFTPHSELDNGKLDAVMVLRSTRIKGVQFFDKLKKGGRHIYIDDVKYLRMCGLKVEPAKQSILMVDGEMPGMTPWRAVTEKGSWMTFVPPPPMSS